MSSLKLLAVFLVVCISVSQEHMSGNLIACKGDHVTACVCEGTAICGKGKKCILGSTVKENKCVKNTG
nr:TPA_exp: hirudin variant hnip_hv5 [Hirudo nipponia]